MGKIMGGLISLLLVTLLFTKCKKEYSYEGGTAVFTLDQTGGNCSAIISGNYNSGVPLNGNNTIQLLVHVSEPGRFSLQTNTAGGMIFSTSGSLGDTGMQTIILNGGGMPKAIGDFVFTPDITPSCNFIISVTEMQETQADYTLSGAPGQCSDPQISGQYQTGIPMSDNNFVVLNVEVSSLGAYTIHTDTLSGISFSASGTFTKTGPQTVKLEAKGKPDEVRPLVFTPKGNNGSGCTFDLIVQSSGPPATYVIVSGQNLCVGTIAGAFIAGIPLTAANTYTLQVYVQYLGDFTIATKTVNGIYFYYSGTFTSFNAQDVTLTGYGTPSVIGNFTYTPEIVGPAPLGGAACDFSLPVK